MSHEDVPQHQIRALHTADTVTVYQAYPASIGVPAVRDGRFPWNWKRDRMTWIKPSYLWMAYRSGWASKPDQEVVLAVQIRRDGFDWALRNAVLSHHDRRLHRDKAAWKRQLQSSPVRAQWDPERDVRLRPLPYRSLQLGLRGEAVERYADEWLVGIREVTPLFRTMREMHPDGVSLLLPVESPYPVPAGARIVPGG
ncbi:DUF4291 domain-containing protein [Streptomyces sp. NPDC091272]|uniref:DUF4291 domain-containing protein n=1 Tax=Streptomyces sp. NPDC091272 TaxID=3365981 RepID=UPI003814FBF4